MNAAEARFRAAEAELLSANGLTAVERYLRLASGVRVRLLEFGSGPPVLLLPGLGMVAACWAPLVAQLSGFRLLAVERPGCGLGDPLDFGGADLRTWATNFVRGVVQALGLERLSIVGNSIGGTSALWYAAAFPDSVESLVLIGAPPFVLNGQAPIGLRLLTLSPIARRALAGSVDRVFTEMGHPSAAVTPQLRELAAASRGLPSYFDGFVGLLRAATRVTGRRVEFPEAELRGVRASTLMIWGGYDTHGAVDRGLEMARVMPSAHLDLRGVGHLPWLDDPAGCGQLIRSFVTGPVTEALSACSVQLST